MKVDDTGVYHGHTGGVSKYSLMDGKEIWHRVLPEAVLSGVKVGHRVAGYIYF